MLRSAFSLCAVLGMASSAFAGAAITLTPSAPANGVSYVPGEVVNVGVFAQLTAGTPSVPGPGGTTTAIRVRLMQFDLSDSNPALTIVPVSHHETSEPFGGPIPFWDMSGASACAGDETVCGNNYFIDGSISNDDILNITYLGTSTSSSAMIQLNQTQNRRVGELSVTMPAEGGDFVLDVLNADETNINMGAEIRWGFGSATDPIDPTSPLRANSGTAAGGITYSESSVGGLNFHVVPEPATLAMLGLGGLAAAFRRRRAA